MRSPGILLLFSHFVRRQKVQNPFERLRSAVKGCQRHSRQGRDLVQAGLNYHTQRWALVPTPCPPTPSCHDLLRKRTLGYYITSKRLRFSSPLITMDMRMKKACAVCYCSPHTGNLVLKRPSVTEQSARQSLTKFCGQGGKLQLIHHTSAF